MCLLLFNSLALFPDVNFSALEALNARLLIPPSRKAVGLGDFSIILLIMLNYCHKPLLVFYVLVPTAQEEVVHRVSQVPDI